MIFQKLTTIILLLVCSQVVLAESRERNILQHYKNETLCKSDLRKKHSTWSEKRIIWACRPTARATALYTPKGKSCLDVGKKLGTATHCKNIDSTGMPKPRAHTPKMPIARMTGDTLKSLLPNYQYIYAATNSRYRVYRSGNIILVHSKTNHRFSEVCRMVLPKIRCSKTVTTYTNRGFVPNFPTQNVTHYTVTVNGLWANNILNPWKS